MKPTDKRFWIAWTSLIILIVVWCMIDGEDKAPEYLKISSYEISQIV